MLAAERSSQGLQETSLLISIREPSVLENQPYVRILDTEQVDRFPLVLISPIKAY